MPKLRLFLSTLFIALLSLSASAADELRLSISDFPMSSSRSRGYLSGQQVRLFVRIARDTPVEKYYGLPYSAPSDLRILAGTKNGATFHENAAWTRQLAPRHYVDELRARADSLARVKGRSVDEEGDLSYLGEFYQFTVTMPDVSTPTTIYLDVVFDHSSLGRLESVSSKIAVYPAQAEYDTRILWCSLVAAAYERNEPQRVIALADSFIALGYIDPDWGEIAKTAAYEHGYYEKALQYLDLNFQVNGITQRNQLSEWDGRRVQITERRQRDYDRQRSDLLAKTGRKQ